MPRLSEPLNMSSIKEQQNELNEWIRFGLRLGLQSALHPFEYAKVLIQIGYEPVAPRPVRSILGYDTMVLPNIFQYVKYIRGVDGYSGCFRGLAPRLVGTVVSTLGSERIAKHFGCVEEKESSDYDDEVASDSDGYQIGRIEDSGVIEERERRVFQRKLKRDIIIHTSTILIAQPFQVISIRMMAQFVGRETIYSSIWASMKEIYHDHGLLGFFSGLVPRLVGDITCLVLASTTAYFVNKHFVSDKDSRKLVPIFTNFVYSTIFYPFQVVSVCMSLTGASLAAGRPPHMPIYSHWRECWQHLNCTGELKRGSSLFWRYYRTPEVINKNFPMTFAPLPTVTKYK
ncbi:mitochondrial carrier homolog 2 [Lutzomyia longipalpis]|uniref:Putative carrier protein n=1 Tax=Lutzomyia longipalpis TaxID=7200 RepID=A0A7G3AQ59_LUTLO|nr:mitochondrial carrier homolog 2 [Lutzomyia longipalpis]XP_055690994.1 mitochondrial carrier homolog 2 [Lutzomyia longipalpis]